MSDETAMTGSTEFTDSHHEHPVLYVGNDGIFTWCDDRDQRIEEMATIHGSPSIAHILRRLVKTETNDHLIVDLVRALAMMIPLMNSTRPLLISKEARELAEEIVERGETALDAAIAAGY